MIRLQMEYAPEGATGGRPETADQRIVAALQDRARPYQDAIAKIDSKALAAGAAT